MKAKGKLRFPTIFDNPTSRAEGEVWYDTDNHKPAFQTADSTIASSFSEGEKFDSYSSGRWYHPQLGVSTTAASLVSRAYAVPFSLPKYAQIGGIAAEVATAYATTAGNVRCGVYYDTGFKNPGTLITDLGASVAASAGVKTWSLTLDLSAYTFWVVLVIQGASGTAGTWRSVGGYHDYIGDTATTPNLNSAYNCYYKDTVTGALPSTFGSITGAAVGPRIALKFNF